MKYEAEIKEQCKEVGWSYIGFATHAGLDGYLMRRPYEFFIPECEIELMGPDGIIKGFIESERLAEMMADVLLNAPEGLDR